MIDVQKYPISMMHWSPCHFEMLSNETNTSNSFRNSILKEYCQGSVLFIPIAAIIYKANLQKQIFALQLQLCKIQLGKN
jgi:hypothetical protein